MADAAWTLDIVIPVYNEGRNIVPVLEALQRSVATPFRVLLCYDMAEDDTLPAAAEAQALQGTVVPVRNRRHGAHGAVVSGFEVSTAPAVLVFPADDTTNAGVIDGMVARCRAGDEIVAASRFMPGGRMVGCPWLKAAITRTANWTLRHLARLPVRDATNGFRLFSRRVLDAVPVESSVGFTYSLELLVKCHRLGWRISEVPTQWFERRAGQGVSRFHVLRWLPAYFRWYAYAFATTYLRRGAGTVRVRDAGTSADWVPREAVSS